MFIESVRLPAAFPDRWPFTMEPVRHLAEHGLTLSTELTVAGRRLDSGPRRAKSGFFLRAETLFNLARNVSMRPGFDHWRRYLRDPQSYLRHFFTTP
jgi:hypothetical protein